MLGVDRLDMIKGIPQKLLAFEEFLEEHPEWRDKVLLVQIAVPSRTDVPEYQASPVLYFHACIWQAAAVSASMACKVPCHSCCCLLRLSVQEWGEQCVTGMQLWHDTKSPGGLKGMQAYKLNCHLLLTICAPLSLTYGFIVCIGSTLLFYRLYLPTTTGLLWLFLHCHLPCL